MRCTFLILAFLCFGNSFAQDFNVFSKYGRDLSFVKKSALTFRSNTINKYSFKVQDLIFSFDRNLNDEIILRYDTMYIERHFIPNIFLDSLSISSTEMIDYINSEFYLSRKKRLLIIISSLPSCTGISCSYRYLQAIWYSKGDSYEYIVDEKDVEKIKKCWKK